MNCKFFMMNIHGVGAMCVPEVRDLDQLKKNYDYSAMGGIIGTLQYDYLATRNEPIPWSP